MTHADRINALSDDEIICQDAQHTQPPGVSWPDPRDLKL
jgi:hypothetical protein